MVYEEKVCGTTVKINTKYVVQTEEEVNRILQNCKEILRKYVCKDAGIENEREP